MLPQKYRYTIIHRILVVVMVLNGVFLEWILLCNFHLFFMKFQTDLGNQLV